MKRTDRLALLDPAPAEGSVRMRATAKKGIKGPVMAKDRDSQAVHLDGPSAPLDDIVNTTDGDEPCQVDPPDRIRLGL